MNRLQSELQRLYLLHGTSGAPGLLASGGKVRVMLLSVSGTAGWSGLSKAWQGVQADLHWPAPAIAVNGIDACQLWFSLAEPAPLADAQAVLSALCTRYLADVPPERIASFPGTTPPALPPAQAAPGRWSAFVAPDLAALFADEAWLDLPPGAEAQADLLSRVQPIAAQEWERARTQLAGTGTRPTAIPPAVAAGTDLAPTTAPQSARHEDPRRFLLAVMNDASVDLQLRIEAAKALLRDPKG